MQQPESLSLIVAAAVGAAVVAAIKGAGALYDRLSGRAGGRSYAEMETRLAVMEARLNEHVAAEPSIIKRLEDIQKSLNEVRETVARLVGKSEN